MIGKAGVSVRLVWLVALLLGLALVACGPVRIGIQGGGTLEVDPGKAMRLPSQAAFMARNDDTVVIAPGEYDDCAVWHANRLTIAAQGPGVIFTGKTCQGKAIFVIQGNNVTVRGITFMHAAVPDHNGAGIRAEGNNLTVEDSHFIDNEEGILAGERPDSTIRIVNSEFRGNGNCIAACAHGIYVGRIALLDVENSQFTDTHEGHDIKSRAAHTVLRGNDISDGPTGHASYLVDVPNGGDLLMEHNTLSKGPHVDNKSTAVSIGAEGVSHATLSLVIRDNSFTNLMSKPTDFVHNLTEMDAELIGNKMEGQVVPLEGPGTVK